MIAGNEVQNEKTQPRGARNLALTLHDLGIKRPIQCHARDKGAAFGWNDKTTARREDSARIRGNQVGIRGENPSFDSDIRDAVVAELSGAALDELKGGNQPGKRLTRRIGSKGFAVLFGCEGTPDFGRLVQRVYEGETSLGDVELRGLETQTKWIGFNPDANDGHGADYTYSNNKGVAGVDILLEYVERGLPTMTRSEFLVGYRAEFQRLLDTDPRTSGRRLKVEVVADPGLRLYKSRDELLAPSPEILAEAAPFVENGEDADRSEYVTTLQAFKGAGGEDARTLALAYSDRWAGGFNSPEYFKKTWDSLRPEAVGWDLIRSRAHRGGWNDGPLDFTVDESSPSPEPIAPQSAPQLPYRSLRTLQEDPSLLTAPVPVLSGLAYKGRTTLLSAREKFGKSTLLRMGAAAVSNGMPFLDGACEQGIVLWCGEENVGDMVRGFSELGANPDNIFILDLRAFGKDRIDQVSSAITALHPALVVVDTLISLTAGIVQDSSKDSQITPIISRIAGLCARLNAACLLSHHATKSGSGYHGSMAYGALVDCVLELKAPGDDPKSPVRRVSGMGRWPVEDFTLRFSSTTRTYALSGAATSPLDRAISYIRANPGATKSNIAKELGVRSSDLTRLRSDLLASKIVRDVGGSRGWSLEIDAGAELGVMFDEPAEEKPAKLVADSGPTAAPTIGDVLRALERLTPDKQAPLLDMFGAGSPHGLLERDYPAVIAAVAS